MYIQTEQYKKGEALCQKYFKEFENKQRNFDRDMRF